MLKSVFKIMLLGKRIDLGAHWIHGRGGNPVWRYVKVTNIIDILCYKKNIAF